MLLCLSVVVVVVDFSWLTFAALFERLLLVWYQTLSDCLLADLEETRWASSVSYSFKVSCQGNRHTPFHQDVPLESV
jgi:hypothetical protein